MTFVSEGFAFAQANAFGNNTNVETFASEGFAIAQGYAFGSNTTASSNTLTFASENDVSSSSFGFADFDVKPKINNSNTLFSSSRIYS